MEELDFMLLGLVSAERMQLSRQQAIIRRIVGRLVEQLAELETNKNEDRCDI
jgi:hypothetical protein